MCFFTDASVEQATLSWYLARPPRLGKVDIIVVVQLNSHVNIFLSSRTVVLPPWQDREIQ
jgi:hypothetical protein